MGIKDEEMEGLSDEERAALEDDEDDSDILGKIAGDDEEGDDEEGDDNEDEEDTGDSSESDADESADAGADTGKDGEQAGVEGDGAVDSDESAPAAAEEFRPELKAVRPEGMAEQLTALDEQSKALMQSFRDGNIDMPEFMAQKEAIDSEKNKLVIADALASQAEAQNEDTRAQRWKWEQERFFSQEKASIYKDPAVLAALDVVVKQLAVDKANANKKPAFFLEEADRQIRKLFNMGGESAPKDSKLLRQPDLSKVPKTLGQLPAAEMAETGNVEFAYLEKLDGMALEAAVSKMTPEQAERYRLADV